MDWPLDIVHTLTSFTHITKYIYRDQSRYRFMQYRSHFTDTLMYSEYIPHWPTCHISHVCSIHNFEPPCHLTTYQFNQHIQWTSRFQVQCTWCMLYSTVHHIIHANHTIYNNASATSLQYCDMLYTYTSLSFLIIQSFLSVNNTDYTCLPQFLHINICDS